MADSSDTNANGLRIAVLGTGTMGAAMARSLLREGFAVTVWNRSPGKVNTLVDAGARKAATPADAVRGADVVLTMLFDAAAVLSVAAEFLPAVREGAIWMQSSTIDPQGMQAVAAAGSQHIAVVDAPVLGSKGPAEHGALTVLASGDRDAVAGSASDSDYARGKAAAILNGDRAPQFALDALLKDLRLAQSAAADVTPTAYLDALERLYAAASEGGHGGEDVAWVYDVISHPGLVPGPAATTPEKE